MLNDIDSLYIVIDSMMKNQSLFFPLYLLLLLFSLLLYLKSTSERGYAILTF